MFFDYIAIEMDFFLCDVLKKRRGKQIIHFDLRLHDAIVRVLFL